MISNRVVNLLGSVMNPDEPGPSKLGRRNHMTKMEHLAKPCDLNAYHFNLAFPFQSELKL